MFPKLCGFLLLISILTILIDRNEAASLEEDLSLTRSQKLVLDKFKAEVSGKLPHDYMQEDIYLIRWLRAKDFNLQRAKEMLMRNLEWRKTNKMDTIHDEDWTDFRKTYKYWIDGEDKDGRPILLIDVGEWDIRKAMLAGQGEKLGRFVDKYLDEISKTTRELRLIEGKNVTQFYFIFDMDGYNIIQQGCPICIAISLRIVSTYETYFPGSAHKIVLFNTPTVFQSLFEILKPLMSRNTREILLIQGRNKKENIAYLKKDIADDQLAVELGGTRILPPL